MLITEQSLVITSVVAAAAKDAAITALKEVAYGTPIADSGRQWRSLFVTSPAQLAPVGAYFQAHVSDHRHAEQRLADSRVIDHGWHVLAGRTAVPIVRGFGAVHDDCAMACRPPGRHLQSSPRLQSCQHRLASSRYEHTPNGTARSLKLADNRREVAFESLLRPRASLMGTALRGNIHRWRRRRG